MPDHYFSRDPASAHRPQEFAVELDGLALRFATDAGVFSRTELDPGSRLLIRSLGPLTGRVLDLGCGWGPVGLFLARKNPGAQLVLADVNSRAVQLAQHNIEQNGVRNAQAVVSDGYAGLSGSFDHVVTNPPIRAGKQLIYALFDESLERLIPGGSLTLVIRKQQGAPSALKHLSETFGSARVIERGGGYWIIQAFKPPEKEEA